MGEVAANATPVDADAKSDSSLESVKAFDQSKAKVGAGALPPGQYDPLRHEDCNYFWCEIDRYFHPVTTADVSHLRNYPVNPYGGAHDEALRLHPNPTSEAAASSARAAARPPSPTAGPTDITSLPCDRATLNSFPLTQRLVAALIDEGGGGQPSASVPRPARGGAGEVETFWPGSGTDAEVRAYQRAMEARVAVELKEAGLLPEAAIGDELTVALRHDQWKLRDMKTSNRARKSALYAKIAGVELRQQANDREHKKHMNETEIGYLERMNKKLKKNKKARNKYQKLLQKMFKTYKNHKPAGGNALGGSLAASPSASVAALPGASVPSGVSPKSSAALTSNASAGTPGSASIHAVRTSGSSVAVADERPLSKNKPVKKKKKKSEGSGSRLPPASKSAASKGKAHHFESMED